MTWKKSDDDFLGQFNPALSRQVTKKKLPGICEMAMGKATKANPSEHVSLTTTRCFTTMFHRRRDSCSDAWKAVLRKKTPVLICFPTAVRWCQRRSTGQPKRRSSAKSTNYFLVGCPQSYWLLTDCVGMKEASSLKMQHPHL